MQPRRQLRAELLSSAAAYLLEIRNKNCETGSYSMSIMKIQESLFTYGCGEADDHMLWYSGALPSLPKDLLGVLALN